MKQFITSWNKKDIEGIMYIIRGNSNKILLEKIASYITQYTCLPDDTLFVFRVLGIFLDNAKLYGYEFDTFTLNTFITWKGILKFLEYNKPYQYFNKMDEFGFSPLLDCARYGNFHTFMYLLKKTNKENYFLYASENNLLNIMSISIYNKDLRIFEYIYNNNELLKHFSGFFDNRLYKHLSPKQNFCIKYIISWANTNDKLSQNIYKKICKLQEIIGCCDFINDILHMLELDIIKKCVKKFNKIIKLKNIKYCIPKNRKLIKILFCVFKENNNYSNIIDLYKYALVNYYENQHIIETIYNFCSDYINNKTYLEILVYYVNNLRVTGLPGLPKILLFLYSKLDFSITPIVTVNYIPYKAVNMIYLCGLNRIFNFNIRFPGSSGLIDRWEKTLKFLRNVCKRKKGTTSLETEYNKSLCCIKYNYHENANTVRHNPVNASLKNILQLEALFYITEKANGTKHKLDMTTIYPTIDYFEIMDRFNITDMSCEKMVVNGATIYMITENFEIISYLRSQHKYVTETDSVFNYNDPLYKQLETDSLNNYIQLNNNKNKILWWPKMVWVAQKHDLLIEFEKIKNTCYSVFETDGWIIHDRTRLIKLKPDPHLTLDLLFNNDKFYYDKHLPFTNITYNSSCLTQNTIYRCYYNKSEKIWHPGEERTDKYVPNNKYIVEEIVSYFKYRWGIDDIRQLESIPRYYELDNITFRDRYNPMLYNLLGRYGVGKHVMDVGCGYTSGKMKRLTRCKKYLGVDCDISMAVNLMDSEFGLTDISRNWKDQLRKQNIYITDIDVIFMVNTIHYCTDIDEFVANLSEISKINTVLVIKFLNLDLLKKIIPKPGDTIVCGANFVKLSTNNTIKYYYSGRFLEPRTEHVFSGTGVVELLCGNDWGLETQVDFLKDTEPTWDNYIGCFSLLVLRRL